VSEQYNLNGGLLVMGSLCWEHTGIRSAWRQEALAMAHKISVPLPIRYGRISTTRYNTYTMVYSMDLPENHRGTGYVVPFRQNPFRSPSDILTAAETVIRVERNLSTEGWKQVRSRDAVSFDWHWGALGLAINPRLRQREDDRQYFSEQLRREWRGSFSAGFRASRYQLPGETAAFITGDGTLRFRWPPGVDDLDFVMGTVIRPSRDEAQPGYPSARTIAEAMYRVNCYNYFLSNYRCGITTFQDDEILRLIRDQYNLCNYLQKELGVSVSD